MNKRKIEIAVLSDVHLGTYECHARELLKYLKNIDPDVLVLNGDFIDFSQFRKNTLSKQHEKIINVIVKYASMGTKVYLITNNKTQVINSFPALAIKGIDIRSKLDIVLKGKRYWMFHGSGVQSLFNLPSFIGDLSGYSYSLLLRSNRMINNWRLRLGKARMSYAGKIRHKVRKSQKAIHDFEETATLLASQMDYDVVVCGHIHRPVIKTVEDKGKAITYMNAGDWVENLTALEYNFGKWTLYEYDELDYKFINPKLHVRPKHKGEKKSDRNEIKGIGSIVEKNKLQADNGV